MNILSGVFEIAVNFLQGFLLAYFPYSYLGDKNKRKFGKSPGMIYAIIIAVVMSVINNFIMFEHFYALIYVAIIFIYSLQSLKGKILKKVFSAIFPSLIMAIISVLTVNLLSILYGISPEKVMTNTGIESFLVPTRQVLTNAGIERFLGVIATQILIIFAISITLKILNRAKNSSDLAVSEWLLISLVFVISIAICAFLNFASFEIISQKGRIYIVFAFIGILLVNAVVYYLVVDLGKKNAAVRENAILKLQQEYNSQYIKNANKEYDLIRKLRHDFKDSYSVIYTLLAEGKTQKAMEHIENNMNILSQTEIFVRTNNDIVNAVVNAQLSTAKSFDIDVTCLSIMDFDGINDLDLCRLLSNMLENAVTACVNSSNTKRHIYLKITSDDSNITFNLKNTIDRSVLADNKNLRTTKDINGEHGYGTQIIKDISEKYHGRCDFYEEDDLFCCNVILKK